jgi:putative endonuclease
LFQGPSVGIFKAMPFERQPCVYILTSKPKGTIYIGVTSDLIGRLYQHRESMTGGFTARHKVYRLVRYEMFGDVEQAILREKQLKRWHRQWKINLIESENSGWHDLAIGLGFEPLSSLTRQDEC